MSDSSERWELNYFNYFTEIEERFQQARGTGLFLLSPVDWALIEAWKNAGVPLEAVLRGIDAAFEKWRSRKRKGRLVNSLTYCTQAVMEEAEAMAAGGTVKPTREAAPPFSIDELRGHLEAGAAQLRQQGDDYCGVIEAVERILDNLDTYYEDLEELEQRVTALEEKIVGIARTRSTDEELFEARREMERQIKPYRGKMTADQLAMLEKQYLERALLERSGLPRLSLFYLV
ncbi:MAG: hypothetical protein GY953_49405 [bacterium]|nr:hypothetical protein [bacterium]